MSDLLLDATTRSFDAEVLEASRALPVLVDFWADWCGPCKMLAPVLERLAADYAGRARIVKVNTDAEMELAQAQGVRSLPTLRLFRHGQAVDEIIGVQPDSAIRAMIERYLERPSDKDRAEAATLLAAGHADQAVLLLQKVLRDEPANEEAEVQLIEALIGANQLPDAAARLQSLPLNLLEAPEVKAIEARLNLAQALAGAPDAEVLRRRVAEQPADLEARHQLAALEFSAGDQEAALSLWLDILRRDRDFGDGAARKSLLQAFELMTDQPELVHRYRRQMMAMLH